MYQHQMEGLGKFKFKKLFKKATRALIKNPFAPPQVRDMSFIKKLRKKKAVAYTPSPVVEQSYENEPMRYVQHQSFQPPTSTGSEQAISTGSEQFPVSSPQPMPQFSEPATQDYLPSEAYQAARNYASEPSPSMYPFDYTPEENETGTENLPIVSSHEFENMYSGEQDYMDGLSEGNAWGDLFTGAAAEILATQKAKREAKTQAIQQAQYRAFDKPGGFQSSGFSLDKMLLPLAMGLGAFLLLRKKRN